MMRRRSLAVLVLTVALAGCTTLSGWLGGDAALQARSVASNGIVLAGETFLTVGAQFNRMCPAKQLSVDTCAGFRKFSEDFKAKYPPIAQAYLDNKDVAADVAAQASGLLGQLTGFAKQANAVGAK